MSGVYIPMEIPKSCEICTFESFCGLWREAMNEPYGDGKRARQRHPNCPLIPVPEHGRTIDADALKAWFVEWYDLNADLEINHFLEILDGEDSAPTIIPGDKEEQT